MTARSDIAPNRAGWRRLSYTRRCGWVDWGHALPGGPLQLRRQLDAEQGAWPGLSRLRVTLAGQPGYIVHYGQAMTGFSAARQWAVRRGLSSAQRESAGLGIYLAASHEFEATQDSFPFSWVTSSGYSAEDLVSNLIGFYGAFRCVPQDQLRAMCGEVSVKESFRLWDAHLPGGLGAIKNHSLRPILFPTQEGVRSPADTSFPAELAGLRASPAGRDWVRLRDRFVPGPLVNAGASIAVDSKGVVTAR